jgi:hypothetical protein
MKGRSGLMQKSDSTVFAFSKSAQPAKKTF